MLFGAVEMFLQCSLSWVPDFGEKVSHHFVAHDKTLDNGD